MLDVAVLPVIRVQSGEIVALTNVEMEHVYNRRRVHMEARRNLLSWAIGMCKVGTGFHMTPKIGYAFWDGAEKPPESFMVGLRSAANVFDKAGNKQMPELHTPVTSPSKRLDQFEPVSGAGLCMTNLIVRQS